MPRGTRITGGRQPTMPTRTSARGHEPSCSRRDARPGRLCPFSATRMFFLLLDKGLCEVLSWSQISRLPAWSLADVRHSEPLGMTPGGNGMSHIFVSDEILS